MGRTKIIAFLGIVLASSPTLARTIFVKADAGGAANGTSWANAFTDLHAALATAGSGDEIWVAAGQYTPSQTGDRAVSFELQSGISLYGGFDGTETSVSQRDVTAHETILSGDLSHNDDPALLFVGNAENSFHVITATNIDDTAVLDGFTIAGGRADGTGFGADPASKDQGSGLNIFDSSPHIANCTFRGNWAKNHATLNDHGIATTIVDCTFRDNYSDSFGAGLYIHHHSATTATHCTFINNVAVLDGGGTYIRAQHMASVTECTYIDNSASRGGGIYTDPDALPMILSCTFIENQAVTGGGIYNDRNECMVDDCIFSGNSASVAGAAVYNDLAGACICDCLFFDNIAAPTDPGSGGGSGGAGVWNLGGMPAITDCTFSGNLASFGAGVYSGADSLAVVSGCTFDDNNAGEGAGVYIIDSDSVVSDCTFTNNTSAGTQFSVGGGLSNYFCLPRVIRCTFRDNAAELGGGAIYNEGFSPLVTNCSFFGNRALGPEVGWGGAMLNSYDCSPVLVNCLFSGNTAQKGGAVFNTVFSSSTIVGCTFSENAATGQADQFGGGIFNSTDTATSLSNSILWGNSPNQIEGDPLTASNTCIQDGYSGASIISADPRYVSAAGADQIAGTFDDDLRLRVGSPCINSGDNALLPFDDCDLDADADVNELLPLDLNGNSRIRASVVDMGAFESVAVPYLPGDLNCDDQIDTADIAPFVSAILNVTAYETDLPYCDPSRADINADSKTNGLDIGLFAALLLSQ